jgi:two-component system, cell cycle sensor histidine kinase and response regulator CckA
MHHAQVRILLVDDDEDDYILTRDLIARIGERRYHLDWLSNFDAGLEAIRRREHDVYLLDYRLGENTGLELLQQAQEVGVSAPIILLTGQGDREIDVEAMTAGAADYLVKAQLNADVLDRAIRYAIAGKRAEENLRRERDLISRITETSPVGIVVADRNGQITFANHRAEEILDLPKDKAANVMTWRSADAEGNLVSVQGSPLQQVLESGQPVENARFAADRGGGIRALLSANAAPLFDSGGQVDGMVVTVEDITRRVSLEAQLLQSQKMECVGQVAAGVAHDINNVLTVIQGHVGLLLNTTPPGAGTEKSLKQILAAADRASRFIRQLLMFSRKQVIETKVLDLNAVLRNLESMLARLLGEDLSLEIRLADIARIEADTGMIEQVIMNLAVNARDAMPKGGKLTITTASAAIDDAYVQQHPDARPGSFVCLTVADTGCGIDRKLLQKIFEPFFSTKDSGKGTGLGLATVYGIVKQHHGWIEVDSKIGVGTTFQIYLPAAGRSTGFATDFITKPTAVRGGRERILVVEDETGLRDLVQRVLTDYQYQVAVAGSGAEALRIWDEFEGKFDLLLTDMIMPGGMNGRELAEELKRRKPDLKIVYTSGYSPDLVGKDLGEGDTRFISKPYLPAALARVIRERLDTPLKGTASRPAVEIT